jgi:hypothetical protein
MIVKAMSEKQSRAILCALFRDYYNTIRRPRIARICFNCCTKNPSFKFIQNEKIRAVVRSLTLGGGHFEVAFPFMKKEESLTPEDLEKLRKWRHKKLNEN